MSHYTVAVIHREDQKIDDLLAPYSENLEVDPYLWKTRDEAIEYARHYYKSWAEDKTDDECWGFMAEDHKVDVDGNIYSTYNPNSKWDWWTIGGRWSGELKFAGRYVNSGKIKDIEIDFDKEEYEYALRFWDVAIDHQPAAEGEEYDPFYKEEYYREHYGDQETYARCCASFTTYAVITPDGKWHSPGEMGWFGCSSESGEEYRDWVKHYKERFIESSDPEWIFTLVDCHI